MNQFSVLASSLALGLALGACSKAESTGGGSKPTVAECTKAFDHWAEVSAKKNGGTKQEKLSIQAGNIANCPTMLSAAGIKCLNDLTEADVATWPSCLGKK